MGLAGSACANEAPADPDYVAGRTTYRTCATCHGSSGEGGAGPALSGILEAFPTCDKQIEWIRLGSDRWLVEVGTTYGSGKPVTGLMPAFEGDLTETEIRQVAFYERVRFGELDLDAVRSDCGL